ncbi:fumarylacetoacetate hydrolase family protein [Nocardioides sp.]|uniref:fumarylacetoacetate hydrolase family protein n=1 Tax=Nocardioides sp. TaxID=35761 RepID=UPI0025DF75FD|nr:fumarylacetoacetate hydrolase family protein [Nocardioides sp.]
MTLLPSSLSERELVGLKPKEILDLDHGPEDVVALETVAVLAPLAKPSKIICVGLNYRDHATETGQDFPPTPLIFAKFPSSIIGPDEEISWPSEITSSVDWEGELAVVIGRAARDITPAEAPDHVFGYTVANDVSARDVQFSDGQWVRGKSLDSFCPLGPWIVTADEFDPEAGAAIRTRVNGEVMQESRTDQLIFPVSEIVSWFSTQFTLNPGDVILTGTPGGVGAFREPPIRLGAGDVVEVTIEGIGTLVNPVVGGQ